MKLTKAMPLYIGLFSLASCTVAKPYKTETTPTKKEQTASNKPTKPIKNTKPSAPETSGPVEAVKSNSTLNYISKYKGIAINKMEEFGIPASITLAQGILESSSGNSDLAVLANNHFGIKCTNDWKGETFLKDDDKPNDCFRKYKKAEESFSDHSTFLNRPRYASLFKLPPDDYKGWAKGLKVAGYATNPQYAHKLIELIERYGLQQYDKPAFKTAPATASTSGNRSGLYFEKKTTGKPITSTTAKTTAANSLKGHYVVQPGDTLYSIAKKNNLRVDQLVTWNRLPDYSIAVGQQLKVTN